MAKFANAMSFAEFERLPRVYADVMTDFGFKKIFGDEELLKAFLNALFEKEGKVIEKLEYLGTDIIPEYEDERHIAYDVHCRTTAGEEFIVEMQRQQQSTYGERCLYYMSRAVVRQGVSGRDFKYRVKPVYGIFLTGFLTKGLSAETIVRQVLLKEDGTNHVFTDKFRMFFINLKDFAKSDDECCDTLEQWIYNIKNMATRTTMPKMAEKSPIFTRMYSLAELAAMSEQERDRYEYALKLQWDRNMDEYTRQQIQEESVKVKADLDKAKAELNQANAELNQANAELNQANAELNQANAELNQANAELNQAKAELMEAKIAMAKAFKENGAPIDLIVKSTGLSREVIEAL